jgi:hypothetical protein
MKTTASIIPMNAAKHPKFDMDMEVLCSLPKEPNGVPMKMLCQDMGFELHAEANKCFENINKRFGVSIRAVNTDDFGRCVYVPYQHWAAVQAIGNEYWQQVHG